MHDIIIKRVTNGVIVTIGCHTFVSRRWTGLGSISTTPRLPRSGGRLCSMAGISCKRNRKVQKSPPLKGPKLKEKHVKPTVQGLISQQDDEF
jgi:hypothetical protein